tara:strand:+ start:301 stop:501 length:201 start_codon:yes stop_codon:yes gene_type:complete
LDVAQVAKQTQIVANKIKHFSPSEEEEVTIYSILFSFVSWEGPNLKFTSIFLLKFSTPQTKKSNGN